MQVPERATEMKGQGLALRSLLPRGCMDRGPDAKGSQRHGGLGRKEPLTSRWQRFPGWA